VTNAKETWLLSQVTRHPSVVTGTKCLPSVAWRRIEDQFIPGRNNRSKNGVHKGAYRRHTYIHMYIRMYIHTHNKEYLISNQEEPSLKLRQENARLKADGQRCSIFQENEAEMTKVMVSADTTHIVVEAPTAVAHTAAAEIHAPREACTI
jgi:hypothetical protein